MGGSGPRSERASDVSRLLGMQLELPSAMALLLVWEAGGESPSDRGKGRNRPVGFPDSQELVDRGAGA